MTNIGHVSPAIVVAQSLATLVQAQPLSIAKPGSIGMSSERHARLTAVIDVSR